MNYSDRLFQLTEQVDSGTISLRECVIRMLALGREVEDTIAQITKENDFFRGKEGKNSDVRILHSKDQSLLRVVEACQVTVDGKLIYPWMLVWAVFKKGVFRGRVVCVRHKQDPRCRVIFDEFIETWDNHFEKELDVMVNCLYSNLEEAEKIYKKVKNGT